MPNYIALNPESPFPATSDRYAAACYHFGNCLSRYHDPCAFRWELSAFLQAFRSIEHLLVSECRSNQKVRVWYADKRKELKRDKALKGIVDTRNAIVHAGMLAGKSRAKIGVFLGRGFRCGFDGEMSPFQPTDCLLRVAQDRMIPLFLDKAHSAISEQLRIQRTWVVESISENEIISVAQAALDTVGTLLREVHALIGSEFELSEGKIAPESFQVLLESDLDPTLLKKWGWRDDDED